MAAFITVMKEYDRMCNEYNGECAGCPLGDACGDEIEVCECFTVNFPEEAEKIIMGWAAEHPVETMKDRFFKMFPNAPATEYGIPRGCPSHLGWAEGCAQNRKINGCTDCWKRPYEERRNE
jgi:hypothetical protein